jgi:oligopeptide/dipeptide ABC transporter ATP-binding protein
MNINISQKQMGAFSLDNPLMQVRGLRTFYYTDMGVAKAVDGIDFKIRKRRILGIVGESGCGKSVTALSIMRLIPNPPGRIEGGEILFEGQDLLKLKENEMRLIRGNRISMIFQEPMTSLNPVFKIGEQIAETIRLHQGFSRRDALEKAIEMLDLVKMPSPEKRIHDYPHQMSGGMRQRVMIAIALSCKPNLMIADEPTTALDVTIQGQILYLIRNLVDKIGTAVILITHDQAVIAENAEEVLVMYAGKIVESAEVQDLFSAPCHPYTIGLMKSIPKPNENRFRLDTIKGVVPNLYDLPPGCAFGNRCESFHDRCREMEPPLIEVGENHYCRCWLNYGRGGS